VQSFAGERVNNVTTFFVPVSVCALGSFTCKVYILWLQKHMYPLSLTDQDFFCLLYAYFLVQGDF